MLSKVLTLALVVTVFGCEKKEYKKKENSNVDIVSELNKGDSEKVVQELQMRPDLTSRERYYLASALSQKGGVDVFSLYAVLELQLFRKNALEWSDLSKEKNPYMKFMKKQKANLSEEDRVKRRTEKWEKYESRIHAANSINLHKPSYEELLKNNPHRRMDQETYNEVDAAMTKKYEELFKKEMTPEERSEEFEEFLTELYRQHQYFPIYELASYYSDLISAETLKRRYINPEKTAFEGMMKGGWEMLYMNILWNTYESIPLIKQMPTLTNEQQEVVTTSLDEYKKLIKDEKFSKVALKNIVVLSGVSLMSIYKQSLDLDQIESMQDLMCNFDGRIIADNYGLIRKRILFLVNTLKDAELVTKELKEYEDKVEELEKLMPVDLDDEDRARYLEDIETFKVGSCFNG